MNSLSNPDTMFKLTTQIAEDPYMEKNWLTMQTSGIHMQYLVTRSCRQYIINTKDL